MTVQTKDLPEHLFRCPLCRTPSPEFYAALFFRCPSCEGIFRNPERLLSPDAERARYERHQNNPDDPGYRTFVSPLVTAITNRIPSGSHGLDFGAGPGPVVSAMLRERGFRTDLYDPYFHPDIQLLENTYDFIFCCEVIEHFYYPASEFPRLFSLIRPGGSLFCMTHIHTDDIAFPSWYYKDDETHVFIYREKTLHAISRMYGFSSCSINGRVVRFDAPETADTGSLPPAEALNPGKVAPAVQAKFPAGAGAADPAEALNPGEVAPTVQAKSPAGAGAADPAGVVNPADTTPDTVVLPASAAPLAVAAAGHTPDEEPPDVRS